MNLRTVVILSACVAIFAVPASSTSLLAAAAAVKGAIVGAGLTALKSSGGSQTVIIQSQPGSVAEVVPANQVVVQDLHKPITVQTAQTITYSSGNPFSRFWGAITEAISAKAKAIGNLFHPNHVVVVVPKPTTEKTTTTTTPKPTPVITVDLNKPGPSIDIDLGNKPGHLPGILPGIDIELNGKPVHLPTIDLELSHTPLQLPSIGVSASVSRSGMYRSVKPVAVINYGKK